MTDAYMEVMRAIAFIEPSGERATLLGMYFGIGQHSYMPGTKDQGYLGRVHLSTSSPKNKYDSFKGISNSTARVTSDLYQSSMNSTYQS